jgi:DNA-binding PadR family transcriptional regulator
VKLRPRSAVDPSFLVLVGLSGGPLHGYAIQAAAERLTGRAMGPGTLYGVLARLERLSLIEAIPSYTRRNPYRLTKAGEVYLSELLSAYRSVVEFGELRLGGVGAALGI